MPFYFALTGHECQRSSLIKSDNEREGSDATDGDDTDFVDVNADVCTNPGMVRKIASHDVSQSNNEAKTSLDFKRKMHRVIPIKTNKMITHLTRR